MVNYVFMTNEENWEIIKKEKIMGLGGQWGKSFFPKIQKNDKCVVYIIKKSVFSGVFDIISKNPEKKIKWRTGNYNYLFKLNTIFIPENYMLVKEHINNLKFIKNKEKWYTYFQIPKIISNEDLEYILNIMKEI